MTTTIYNQNSEPIHKISDFVFNEADMGESSITCDIYLSADTDPMFSREWYIDYRGEKFYLSTLQPPAIKDNSEVRYKYSLTFKSEREDLKRYDMLDLVKANEEDFIPDKYSFSFQGDIVQFVDRFNANLKYNFGSRWEMRLAEGVSSESVVVSCQDGVKMWDLLKQVYTLYGIRWHIASEADKMVIFVGYEPAEVEHIFQYDPDKTEEGVRGGLYSIERVNPLSEIYTRMRGVGGTRNLPYRYFKNQSQVESEKQYPADPDYNNIIANNNYANLMPKCFRDYLKGWNGTPLSPETEAYKKGKADKLTGKFIPMDYVVSDKEAKWGIKYGALQANENIYPTIQGTWDSTLGRLDEIVAVSEVKDDKPEQGGTSESPGVVLSDNIEASRLNIHRGPTYGTYQSAAFTLTKESTIKMIVSASWKDSNNMEVSFEDGSAELPVEVQSIDIISSDGLTKYNVLSDATNPRAELLAKGPIPAGDYYIEVNCSSKQYVTESYQFHSYLTVSNIIAYDYSPFSEDMTVDSEDSRIFYIWIKDIGFDIREEKYWALGQGDMAVMFSDGWLAGEDYEYTIAAEKADDKYTKFYIAEDTSKSIETTNEQGEPITVQSKWKIGLIRSDAELEASGKYIPNTVINAKPGDHFFFVNIQLPQKYVELAEERMQSYIETELSKVDDEYPTFTIKPSSIFCNSFAAIDKLKAGARIRIRNQRLMGDGYLVVYISSITLTHSKDKVSPTWDVVVSETPSAGENAITLLQGQVQQLSQNVYSSQSALAEAISQMDRIFVRGDGLADTSYSPTTFARQVSMNGEVKHGGSVTSNDFNQAGFAGTGWGLYKDANSKYCLEIDKVNVRGELNVNEATINQIEFLSGKTIYSRGGIEVTDVEDLPDGYKLFYDTKNGDRMNPFKVNDLAYSQNFNDPDGNIIKYYWAVITEVGDDYIVISKTQKDGSGIPTKGDNVAQLGNTEDASRQSAFIIDQTSGGINVQYNRLGDATAPGGMWSFQDRATVGFGYDAEDGKAKFFCYGDAYIGNRDLSKKQYVTYQQKEGDSEPKLYVSGSILVGEGSEGLGNLSEWAEKQEQIDAAQQTAESAAAGVESLKNFTDDAFADGIVDRAEAAAIEKYMNSVTETKESVNAAYNTVYNNSLLGGSAKSNLQAAKSTFDTAVADLLAAIDTASSDGIATPTEKADVDSKYETFNVACSGFSTAIEEAQKYIQTAINTTAQGAYQLSQKLQGVVNNLNEAIIPDLQAQIDKQIVSYNGDEVPTLDNYPANEWQDDTERDRHINDYYDRKIAGSSGEVSYERYKFTKDSDGYKWIRIADSGAAEAQAKAIEALGVANGKNKVYFGDSTPSVPYIINDLWIKTSGDIYISNADRNEGATGSIADWQLVNDAQLRLRQMSSDNVISKEEKSALRNRLAQMQKEYASYQSDASKYGVSITALQTAYNNLTTFLTGTVAVNNDTDTTLSAEQRTTYNTYFANYDAEVSRFTNLVSDAIAQGKVNNLEISSINMIDGSESITLSAGSNNYFFKKFPIGLVNSGDRYSLSVQAITNIEGNPSEYSVAIYDTAITTKLSYGVATLSSDRKSVVFSLNNNIINKDAVLLLYPGIGGSTAGNTVQLDKVMFVRGDKPALSWQPSYNDQKDMADNIAQDKIDGIKIGGVNLLDDSEKMQTWAINELQYVSFEQFEGYDSVVIRGGGTNPGVFQRLDVGNIDYTASVYVFCSTMVKYLVVGLAGTTNRYYPSEDEIGKWIRISMIQTPSTTSQIAFYCYAGFNADYQEGDVVAFRMAQLEEGTKATAWKESPNDVQASIDEAKKAGEEAKAQLDKWSSDSYISPTEKTGLKQQQADIQAEYNEIIMQAAQYGVSTTAYTTAYNKANDALTKYTAATPAEITIGSDYANIAAYYTARQTVLDAVAEAIKKYSEDLVDNIQIGGVNLLNGTQKFIGDNWSVSMHADSTENGYKEFTVVHRNSTSASTVEALATYKNIQFDYGQTYTLSFFAKGTGGIYLSSSYIAGQSTIADSNLKTTINISATWTRFDVKFTATTDTSKTLMNIMFRTAPQSNVYICAIKLEEGNKATAWTPTPFDLQSDTEYLRELFQEGQTEISGGVVMTNAVAVKDPSSEEVVAMMNGSREFYDPTHKTAMHVLGIKGGVKNWQNAPTILYEDGFIQAQNAKIGIFKVNPNTVEVTTTENDNVIILRTQNITSVSDAIGSSTTTPSVSTKAIDATATVSDPFVMKTTESSTFNLTVDTVMSCSIQSTLNASGTGSAKVTVEAVPTDGVSPSVYIYSRGASPTEGGGSKQESVSKILTNGSYKMVVTITCSRLPLTTPVSSGYASVSGIEYSFSASTRRNLIAPNGMAVVQATNKYAVFTGDIFEVRLGNGGFRITSTGTWQKYDSTTGKWENVNV